MKEQEIRNYTILIDFFSSTLGQDYEVALQDTEKILLIRNGRISGRTEGDPLSPQLAKAMSPAYSKNREWIINVPWRAENGKVLRGSALYIRGENGEMLGALTISYDDSRVRELTERMIRICHPGDFALDSYTPQISVRRENSELIYGELGDVMDDVIHKVVGSNSIDGARLTFEEKLEIVRRLQENGVFDVKGAVRTVAKRIGSSQASMYRYITMVKSEKN